MHQEVWTLINTLSSLSSINNHKFHLEMVEFRITYIEENFAKRSQLPFYTPEHNALIQEFLNLYCHIYNKRPLQEFK